MKGAKSAISIKTSYSSADLSIDKESENIEFENYFPFLARKYNFDTDVVVEKVFKRDDYLLQSLKTDARQLAKPKNSRRALSQLTFNISKMDATLTDFGPKQPAVVPIRDTLEVQSIYDLTDNLVEVRFGKRVKVTWLLVKIIGLIAPKYPKLVKLSFNNSWLDSYTIYELHKCSNLTSICLDGCVIPEANYFILLDNPTQLQNLSLCRCKINGEVCKEIALRLHYPSPAENSLVILNLTSNHINDIGAQHLATALRSNRHLRSLSLADNRITDDGAAYLLDVLKVFPLTHDEIVNKRRKRMEYLRAKQTACDNCINELCPLTADDPTKVIKLGKKKRPSLLSLKSKDTRKNDKPNSGGTKAEKVLAVINQILGPYNEPFIDDNLIRKDGYPYCKGNLVLCHLNLSYNNLSYISLKKLKNVMLYQLLAKGTKSGLVKVGIEGNDLPIVLN